MYLIIADFRQQYSAAYVQTSTSTVKLYRITYTLQVPVRYIYISTLQQLHRIISLFVRWYARSSYAPRRHFKILPSADIKSAYKYILAYIYNRVHRYGVYSIWLLNSQLSVTNNSAGDSSSKQYPTIWARNRLTATVFYHLLRRCHSKYLSI